MRPMSANTLPIGHSLPELVEVMQRLLAPDGCAWDREQTLDSLKPFLLEETYEVLESLESGIPTEHCEELGDLLMQIVFQAAIRQAEGAFGIDDVVRSIVGKLVRRHPHVFATAQADTPEEVLVQWHEIKRQERRAKAIARGLDPDAPQPTTRALDGVPAAMPALARAQHLSSRAARVGFDWPSVAACREKVSEEIAEVDAAIAEGDQAHIDAEIGDLLLATTSLARKLGVDAEGALRRASLRFTTRFEAVEDRLQAAGKTPQDSSIDELEALWQRVKAEGIGIAGMSEKPGS